MSQVLSRLLIALFVLGTWPVVSLAQPAALRPFTYVARPTTPAATALTPSKFVPASTAPQGSLTIVTQIAPQGTTAPSVTSLGTSPSPSAGSIKEQAGRDSRNLSQSSSNSVPVMPKEMSSQKDPVVDQQSNAPQTDKTPTRVTNPMLQHMSNPSNLSQTGIVTGLQMAPNQYFGRQFDNWSGQMAPMPTPGATGELPRFQPGPFGGYIAPNTYYGTGFSSWSNLSSGTIEPSPFGGWSYSPW